MPADRMPKSYSAFPSRSFPAAALKMSSNYRTDHKDRAAGRPIIRCAWPSDCTPVDNGPLHTLEETAKHLGLTPAKVNAIETTAFRKLKNIPEFLNIAKDWRRTHA